MMLTSMKLCDIIVSTKGRMIIMMNEKNTNKHIEEVASYLAQFMEFPKDEIAKALTKHEMDIDEDISIDNVKNGNIKICGDAIIFDIFDYGYVGVNVRTMRYLNDFECYNIINPDWRVI